jgi:hypothetical protein
MDAQQIKIFLFFLWKPKVYYRVHNSPAMVLSPGQLNPVHNLTPHFKDSL